MMSLATPHRSSRRGFALLATLAAVVVIMAALGGLIAALAHARAEAASTDDDRRVLDLLASGEKAALDWATASSPTIVFPPEGGRVPLLHDVIQTDGIDAELEVVLYDGCAAVPIAGASLASPLRLALPGTWQSLAVPPDLKSVDALERLAVPAGLRRFPRPIEMPVVRWGDEVASDAQTGLGLSAGDPPALAEVVSPWSMGQLNINTAPEPLLRLAFQELELGGIEDFLASRAKGDLSTAPTTPESAPVKLVSASPVWHGLIATRWRDVRRSWWVVLRVGNQGRWEILQRHDADR